jgi:hypothetical protein
VWERMSVCCIRIVTHVQISFCSMSETSARRVRNNGTNVVSCLDDEEVTAVLKIYCPLSSALFSPSMVSLCTALG